MLRITRPGWSISLAGLVALGAAGCTGDTADGNHNGADVPAEQLGTRISVTKQAAPSECPSGSGEQIDSGIDENGNGTLDADEIDETVIVCDGEDGEPGAAGPAGMAGPAGTEGPGGVAGEIGPQGEQGIQGEDGVAGLDASGDGPRALSLIGTYESGVFAEGAAEIVAHHPGTQRLFVINSDAGVVQVLDLDAWGNPTDSGEALDAVAATEAEVAGFAGDGVNSVAVGGDLVAVAVENDQGDGNGRVAFYNASDLSYAGSIEVGVLPDAVTFSPDATQVVVSCEGEQLRDDDDMPVPAESTPGSVTVINVVGGAPGVATDLDFTAFDSMGAQLRNRGVRISSDPNGDVDYFLPSNDLEPEFAAVSPDGDWAMVTLQENNAVAIVDLTVPSIVDVLPLQPKSWYNFIDQGSLVEVVMGDDELPDLGTAGGVTVKVGGFSGLALVDVDDEQYTFWTMGDRGPQTDKPSGTSNRPHVLNDYVAQVYEIVVEYDGEEAELVSGPTPVIDLMRADGTTPITGLANDPLLDPSETPVNLDLTPLSHAVLGTQYDAFGGDFEGIVRQDDGSFWMVDEYRPAIYHFAAPDGDGESDLIQRYVPAGTSAASDSGGNFGLERLPAAYLNRRANRGFEAVALDEDSGLLYAFIQSPMDNPDNSGRGDRRAIRIVEFNITSETVVGEYLYFLEAPSHRAGGSVDKIGDAIYDPELDVFYVIERDSSRDAEGKKYIFQISLKGATNILGVPSPIAGKTYEQATPDELFEEGVQGVSKIKLTNLPSMGYMAGDKPEGLVMLPNRTLVVLNDNDFGLADGAPDAGNVSLATEFTEEVLGFLPMQKPVFDASDRDDKVALENWPVIGMLMPDSIASYEAEGKTYYVTANEGDSRDYDEWRGDDFDLDAPLFDSYGPGLQEKERLGRLQCSNIDGDFDGDGEYEELFCYGGRSFSIYDAFGNQVFDSGDVIESLVALLEPDFFNSDDEDYFSADSRSDAKGPEPEGVVTGTIDGRTFAFVGLERQGGVFVADITDPRDVRVVDYVNNRNFIGDPELGYAGDLGPEGLAFIRAADSPSGDPLLVVGNETSGTTSVFRVNL